MHVLGFFELSFEFHVHDFHESLLSVFKFVFIMASSFLKLIKSELKFLLRVLKIFFVCILLLFQELAFAFPKSILSIKSWLEILFFLFKFLDYLFHPHVLLTSEIERWVIVALFVKLLIELVDLVLILFLHLPKLIACPL